VIVELHVDDGADDLANLALRTLAQADAGRRLGATTLPGLSSFTSFAASFAEALFAAAGLLFSGVAAFAIVLTLFVIP
jgi:hypothetical protein